MFLDNLIGLTKQKAIAKTQISACVNNQLIFPHTIISSIGGTGKTALCRAIGSELKYHFVEVIGSVFKYPEEISNALKEHSEVACQRGRHLLFFIDEVHQLRRTLQESLYSPMKEWRISTSDGFVSIPKFCLMAATTRFDLLDANSFITRFVNKWEISRYSETEIACIVAQKLRSFGFSFGAEVSRAVASRCLGIPRTAVNLAEKLQFEVLSGGGSQVKLEHVQHMFMLEEIDVLGLSSIHRRYVNILDRARDKHGNHTPLGVGAIAAKMRQPEDMIKGSVESILFELNFVSPTPRGRCITVTGLEYLNQLS